MTDCKFCDKKGLLIFPLRYAVVGGGVGGKAPSPGAPGAAPGKPAPPLIPPLPATLGAGVSDLTLSDSRYAPRMLRNGYLYVLISRAKILYWEGYMVIDDAFLFKFPVDLPPPANHPPFSCEKTSCGLDATVISIENIATVDKIYFLYSTFPLTQAKLADYKANPLAKSGKSRDVKRSMQEFDPKKWVAGGMSQDHSLKPEEPIRKTDWIPTFRAHPICVCRQRAARAWHTRPGPPESSSRQVEETQSRGVRSA